MSETGKNFSKAEDPIIAEKISQVENKYSGLVLVKEVLKIEGFKASQQMTNKDFWEFWQQRFNVLCMKYGIESPERYWPIL